jgi:hypothetical protein
MEGILMETDLEAFARAVRIQAEWIRSYIDVGSFDQAKECACALHQRAEHALLEHRCRTIIPHAPETLETPLQLLNSPNAQALARAMHVAAECARAVDHERRLPYAGSYGEYLQHLAEEIDMEVNGPLGLRGME